MKLAILGAGAWGTALAIHTASRHEVSLWSRNLDVLASVRAQRVNQRYLPDVPVPEGIQMVGDLAEAVEGAELVVMATSVAGLQPVAEALAQVLGSRTPPPSPERPMPLREGVVTDAATASVAGGRADASGKDAPAGSASFVAQAASSAAQGGSASDPFRSLTLPGIVSLAKGLQAATGRLPHQVLADALPGCAIGCLSGPSFAQEVAAGLPAALTAASGDAALGHQMVGAFHHSALRTYRSTDIVGVEVGGALKNIMAVATGVCDGLGLGLNARSALLTRGLAEITRFGLAQGAEAETFLGLAGVGDLVLTCTGDLSRNRRVGLMLAKGHSLADILAELGHVAEGVACCPAVVARAEALQVDLPISWSVQQVIEGHLSPLDAVAALLAREPRDE